MSPRVAAIGGILIAGAIVGLTVISSTGASPVSVERVSVATGGAEGDLSSTAPGISADGQRVAFESTSTNLVAGDTNGVTDIFVRDRLTNQTTRVSIDNDGVESDDGSFSPDISADGRYVSFYSIAENLVDEDTADFSDAFVYDVDLNEIVRVSVHSDGSEGDSDSTDPQISAVGRFVVFESRATNLVDNDGNGRDDIFIHDRQTGGTERVSVSSAGTEGDFNSSLATVSGDGRYVAFTSSATNLIANDTNGVEDVFVRDRDTAQTTRVSVDSDGNQADLSSAEPAISDDGRYVAFRSSATNLAPGDTNGFVDIFVHDRQTGETKRVSVDSGGTESNGSSSSPRLSPDGRLASFRSLGSNLVAGDTNANNDVFIHNLKTGETARASVDGAGDQATGGPSFDPSLSFDGQFLAFASVASNLVAGDNNGQGDVFVSDRGPQPSPAPTPTPTPTPSPTPTLAPTASLTPSPMPSLTPTQTATPGPELVQGDVDCDGDADSVDALKELQEIAAIPYTQAPDCPQIGDEVASLFGDVDCDDDVDSVDGLKILQSVAAIAFTQDEPCADIGDSLT